MLISIVAGIVLTVLGIQLCAIKIPHKKETYKLRIARKILATSYFILAIPAFLDIFNQENYADPRLIQTCTLITASYESLLYTATLLIMIRPNFVTARRVSMHIFFISLFSALYAFAQYEIGELWIFAVALGLYLMQLAYYVYRYNQKHSEGIKMMEQYYDDDLHQSLSWTKFGFYAALTVGVVASVSALLPFKVYTIFTISYVIFYAWFANRFLNYVARANYYIPAVLQAEDPQPAAPIEIEIAGLTSTELETKKNNLKAALDKWVAEEKYTRKDEGKEYIAKELGTEPSFLVWYFRNEVGQGFRPWRVGLRIGLAKKLLNQPNLEMSMNELAERVGFTTKSNFYGHFKKLTGETPVEFQQRMSSNN